MAPSHSDAGSSDSEDAPEIFSLAQSKQHVKKQKDVLEQIQAAEKLKKKTRNQERDRRLKEQAENSKRKRVDRDSDLQERMERAMRDAEAEMGEHLGSEGSDSDEEDEFRGIDGSSGAEEGKDESEEGDSGSDQDSNKDLDEEPPFRTKSNANHLPDHLFEAAFSQSARSSSKRRAKDDVPVRKVRRRPGTNASPKDVLIGPRAIRTLPQTQVPSGASTLPSAKVKKFLDRTLVLKGGRSGARGWERRPANIGVMRRDGPAASFVRNR